MLKKVGKQSVSFQYPVGIKSAASVAGAKEGEGPLGSYFDVIESEAMAGEVSWEQAESKLVQKAMQLALDKAGLTPQDIDYVLAGDLLNQSMGTSFGIKEMNIPFLGIFGACSTFGEGLSVGAMLIDGGFANHVLLGASSHFCAAEKQFRFPLEMGGQRPPTASWTVTGDGSVVLSRESGNNPAVTAVTTGKIIDMGIKDANNMGAAMAPAAADTILAHFKDFNCRPEDYDLIATGDLGHVGAKLLQELVGREGYNMGTNYTDCGMEIFDQRSQDTHAGGSGCACAAITFCGYFMDKFSKGQIKKMLLVPTGALLSPTSAQQGLTIPSIAHGVVIEKR